MQLALALAEGRPVPARLRGRLILRASVTAPNTGD